MLTAALLELHPEPERFLDKINAALGGRALISAERAEKCGVFCTRVSVRINGDEEGEELHHHGHTSLAELEAYIDGMSLPGKGPAGRQAGVCPYCRSREPGAWRAGREYPPA